MQHHVDESGKEGTGGQDNRAATERYADLGCDADRAIAFEQDVVDLLLEQPQIGLVLKSAPDRVPVQHPVSLRPGRPDSRSLGSVQRAKLDPGLISSERHGPVERIEPPSEMTFADASDGRVARHLAQGLYAVRTKQRRAAEGDRRQCSLGTGVTAADHGDVELARKYHVVRNFT